MLYPLYSIPKSSIKSKRVTRSILASEVYNIVAGADIAIALLITLKLITKQLDLPTILLIIYTDSYSLYKCLIKLDNLADAIMKSNPNKALETFISINQAIVQVKVGGARDRQGLFVRSTSSPAAPSRESGLANGANRGEGRALASAGCVGVASSSPWVGVGLLRPAKDRMPITLTPGPDLKSLSVAARRCVGRNVALHCTARR
ncbi:unnamed protein product [Diplocarpon coronariae]